MYGHCSLKTTVPDKKAESKREKHACFVILSLCAAIVFGFPTARMSTKWKHFIKLNITEI